MTTLVQKTMKTFSDLFFQKIINEIVDPTLFPLGFVTNYDDKNYPSLGRIGLGQRNHPYSILTMLSMDEYF